MRRILVTFCAVLMAAAAFAQTPEEIVSRMEKEMEKHEKDGMAMTVDIKLPIIGTTTTRMWMLGDKERIEASLMGVSITTWDDGITEWSYNKKSNEIEIKNSSVANVEKAETADTEMFNGITDGYDVSIKKETGKLWYISCKKSKKNKTKDAPKTMDLVISKGTYLPVSLSAKVSSVTMTMREISFGISEKQVTFNISDYPDAKIIDKRK